MREQHVAVVLQDLFHSVVEVRVTDPGAVQTREQIRDETQEERNILKHELGQVHVTQGSHQHNILVGRER